MTKKNIIKNLLEEKKITPDQYLELNKPDNRTIVLFILTIILGIGLLFMFLKPDTPKIIREVVTEVTEKVIKENPEVIGFSPVGNVNDISNITAVFSRKMASDSELNIIRRDIDIKTEPDIKPSFIWTTPYQLKIIAEKTIYPGTKLKITFDKDIKDIEGRQIKDKKTFSFIYKPFKIENVYYNNYSNNGAVFNLRFNTSVNSTILKEYMNIEDNSNNPVKFDIIENGYISNYQRVMIQEPDISNKKLVFIIKKGFKPFNSNYPLEQEIKYTYGPIDKLSVYEIHPITNQTNPEIEIRFNKNIKNINDIKGFISINNDTNIEINKKYWSSITVSSDRLRFGDTYTVVIKKDLRIGIYSLLQDYTRVIHIPDARPQFKVKTTGVMQSRKGQLVIPVEYINTDTLYLTLYQIYDNNLVYFANNYDYAVKNYDLFYKLKDFKYPLSQEKNKLHKNYIDLIQVSDKKIEGAKILKFSYNNSGKLENKLLIMTDLGISYKNINQTITVLVTSLKDGLPINNADVKIYSKSNQVIAESVTDNNGIAEIKNVSLEKGKPTLVIVKKEKDINYLSISKGYIPVVGFNIKGDKYIDAENVDVFVYGEREIYRPGEKVKLKLLVRGKDLKVIPDLPLEIIITAPNGKKVLERPVRLNSFGTADFVYNTLSDAVTGFYSVNIKLSNENKYIGTSRFQLEEFVPDRIETKISSDKKTAVTDETVKFDIEGKFLFGKPASGNKVKGVYSILPEAFNPEKYADFTFGDNRVKFKEIFQELKESKLNEEGKYRYSIKIPAGLEPPSALKMIFTGTVFDMGARGVSSRSSVSIYPYPCYIGIKSLVKNTRDVKYNETIKFKLIAVKPAGKLIKARKIKIRIYRKEWTYSLRADNRGRYRYQWEKKEELIKETGAAIEDGSYVFPFKVTQWGDFIIEVQDSESKSKSSYEFSCGWWWYSDNTQKMDFDKLDIMLDKKEYGYGDKAKVKIKAPFDGEAYIFIENNDIKFIKHLPIKKCQGEFDLDVLKDYAPNVYISAILVRGTENTKFNNFRAIGIVPMKVIDISKIINVSIDIPKKLKPGKEEEITIKLADYKGKSVDGEADLSIVDKGILQLSSTSFGSAYDYYYRKRGNYITNSDVFSYINGEPDTKILRKLTPSGGMSENLRLSKHKMPVKVKEFKGISYWFPDIKVKNGIAKIKWKAPDFSGRLVFRVWADSLKHIGYKKISKEIKQPVILETTLPRAVTPGDKFFIPYKIVSNIQQEIKADINIKGVKLLKTNVNKKAVLKTNETFSDYIEVQALDGIGNGEIDIILKYNDKTITKKYYIPLRPAFPVVPVSDFHILPVGKTFKLDMKDKYIKNTVSYKFIFSKMPSVKLLSGLEYLIQYPYGCIEQTTSRLFPQLYLKDILKLAESNFNREQEIERNINFGINKLISMMRYDGGFSYWQGGREVYPYGSVYASHFLIEASNAGYPVPAEVLAKIKTYLQAIVNTDSNDNIRAYACYVLSLAGKHNLPIEKMLLKKIRGFQKYYLIAALSAAGDAETIKEYAYVRTPNVGGVKRSTYGYLKSDVTAAGVMLNTMLDISDNKQVIDSLAASLIKKAKYNGRWGSTHDNAIALIALGKYFNKKSVDKSDFSGSLIVDGTEEFKFNSNEDTFFIVNRDIGSIEVKSSGSGNLHFTIVSEGIPLKEYQKEVKQEVEVEHKIYNGDGSIYNSNDFDIGKLYVIETKIKINKKVGNLFLEDIVPGGFEIENMRLATQNQSIPFLTKNVMNTDYVDIKDDRIVVFFSVLSNKKEYIYKYLVRAVNKGNFYYPASTAGCMYDPDIKFVGKNEGITVK